MYRGFHSFHLSVTLVFKLSIIDGTCFSFTAMQRKTYVTRICVLLFLIIEDANVNGEFVFNSFNLIEMKSLLASSVVDRGFETRWSQTKDYKSGPHHHLIEHYLTLAMI